MNSTSQQFPPSPSQVKPSSMCLAALDLVRRGFAVFPVHSIRKDGGCTCGKQDCGSIGKHPKTTHGVDEATHDEKQIKRWWTLWPDANIGIATGTKSGCVVLDVDGEVGMESLRKLEEIHGPLPATLISNTGGGGKHFFVTYDPAIGNSVGTIAPGIDTRGDGGYVVAPPSTHKSGRKYQWGD